MLAQGPLIAIPQAVTAQRIRGAGALPKDPDDRAGATGGETPLADRDEARQTHREILQLVAEGKSTKEIANLLDVSIKTVETHRARLMDRLDIHDLAGLVRFAIRTGLIPTGE